MIKVNLKNLVAPILRHLENGAHARAKTNERSSPSAQTAGSPDIANLSKEAQRTARVTPNGGLTQSQGHHSSKQLSKIRRIPRNSFRALKARAKADEQLHKRLTNELGISDAVDWNEIGEVFRKKQALIFKLQENRWRSSDSNQHPIE